MKGKITESRFVKEWKGPKGSIFYHDIEVDGKTYNIGAKDESPAFLNVGQEIEFEIKDGNKIKRVQPDNSQRGGGGGGRPYNNDSREIGMMVGASLNQAVLLCAHGVIEIGNIPKIAKRLCEISKELKEEYEQ